MRVTIACAALCSGCDDSGRFHGENPDCVRVARHSSGTVMASSARSGSGFLIAKKSKRGRERDQDQREQGAISSTIVSEARQVPTSKPPARCRLADSCAVAYSERPSFHLEGDETHHALALHFEHSGITGLQFLEIFPEFPYGAEGLSVERADHVPRSQVR